MATRKIEVNFVSNNPHKIIEVEGILESFGIKVNPLKSKVREIQSNSLEEIAADSARITAEAYHKSIVVEDAGLFIESLGGFPGPYSSYVFGTIGCKGVLKLMEGVAKRTAIFRSAVSYCEINREPKVFTGETRGKISLAMRGGRKFGYDPIFIPNELDGRAFSELTVREKNKVSHRSKAFNKLANWLLKANE
nr:XTP/dITP diphosphatase [Candidatus Njordarchaeota archaeon]